MQPTSLTTLQFDKDGFLLVRGLASESLCERMRHVVQDSLDPLLGPAEFETDVGYVGAPASRTAPGGNTPRRLLNAYSRDPVFREWAGNADVREHLQAVMRCRDVALSQCHHNCVMTKQPGFSSETLWHQDIRYWSFDRPELISVWLALGEENENNGALSVIPGSHQLDLDRGRLDAELFLRRDVELNRALISKAQVLQLSRGDVLFFHCRLFHAAGMNQTEQVKLSVVSTYHDVSNAPIPGTRSAQFPSVPL